MTCSINISFHHEAISVPIVALHTLYLINHLIALINLIEEVLGRRLLINPEVDLHKLGINNYVVFQYT